MRQRRSLVREDLGQAGSDAVERHGQGVIQRYDSDERRGQDAPRPVLPQYANRGSGIGGRGDGREDDAGGERRPDIVQRVVHDSRGKNADQCECGQPFAKQDGHKLAGVFLEGADEQFAAHLKTDDTESKEVKSLEFLDVALRHQLQARLSDENADDQVSHHLGNANALKQPPPHHAAEDSYTEYEQYTKTNHGLTHPSWVSTSNNDSGVETSSSDLRKDSSLIRRLMPERSRRYSPCCFSPAAMRNTTCTGCASSVS